MDNNITNEVEQAYTLLVDAVRSMGYNTKEDQQNLKESPKRITKGFFELIQPKDDIVKGVASIMKDFDTNYSGMVMAQNIITFSMCPHHFLPVMYRISVAYLPLKERTRVLGVSKLSRLATLLSARPVLQETLTTDIAESLSINNAKNHRFAGLKSDGSAVTIEGIHLCMAARGIKQHESRIITQKLCGSFMTSPELRAEYIGFVNSLRPQNIM